MQATRRTLLKTGLATLGASAAGIGAAGLGLTSVAWAHGAGEKAVHVHDTANGTLSICPIQHASFVLETPDTVIYADPVGGADAYSDLPPARLILVTHEHGDHYDEPTLSGLLGDETRLVVNPNVLDMLSGELAERAVAIGNGDVTEVAGLSINAMPAYNLTEERLQYHPKGRDNGYVLSLDGTRIYIAGDTESIPEMRALSDIDIAFVPMNLPYTMGIRQAAEGVLDFAPGIVYPYHHKGSDITEFASLVRAGNDAIEVVQAAWYS